MKLNRKCHYWLEFGSNLEILWKKHTFFSEKTCFFNKNRNFRPFWSSEGLQISTFCKIIWNSIESVIIGQNLDQSQKFCGKNTHFLAKKCVFLIEFAIFGYLRAIFDQWRPANNTKSIRSIIFCQNEINLGLSR